MKNLLRLFLFNGVCAILVQNAFGQNGISATITEANSSAQCADGAINLYVNSSFVPYSFEWESGDPYLSMFSSQDEDLNGLVAGTYSVTVTDALCGTASSSFTVGCDDLYIIHAELNHGTPGPCNDGSISISVVGGEPPYSYQWKSCSPQGFQWPILSTTNSVDDLQGGEYCVTITDFNDETLIESYTINCACPTKPDIYSIADIVDYCGPNNQGSISIPFNPSGYIVNWWGPNGFNETTLSIDGLTGGTYGLTLSYGLSCHYTYTFEIGTTAFFQDATISNNTTQGQGFIELNVDTYPEGNVSYQWSNGETTSDIFNLYEEVYSVTVTSEYGCSVVYQYEIEYETCYDDLDFSIDYGQSSPCGYGQVGEITLEFINGVPPYSIHFGKLDLSNNTPLYSHYFETNDQSFPINLIDEATVYSVLISDANGLCHDDSFYIPCDCGLFIPNVLVHDRCMYWLDFDRSKLGVGRLGNRFLYHEYGGDLDLLPWLNLEKLVFHYEWDSGDECYATFDVQDFIANPGVWNESISGDPHMIITNPGVYCATITDPFGCQYFRCEGFSPYVECLSFQRERLEFILNNFYHDGEGDTDDYFPVSGIATGCTECGGCIPYEECQEIGCFNDEYRDPFTYLPEDFSDPCAAGTFFCRSNSEEMHEVPAGIQFVEIIDWYAEPEYNPITGKCTLPCGCLYPDGTFPDISGPVWIETEILLPPGYNCEPVEVPELDCAPFYYHLGFCIYQEVCTQGPNTGIINVLYDYTTILCIEVAGESCNLALYCPAEGIIIEIVDFDYYDCEEYINCELIGVPTLTDDNPNAETHSVVNLWNLDNDPLATHIEKPVVYPNPFTDEIKIRFRSKERTIVGAKITSLLGEDVWHASADESISDGNFNIDLTDSFAPGVYLLVLKFDDGVEEVYKLVKPEH